MSRTASAAAELSIVLSPIESTIAGRLFRSIAFLLVSVGCAAASLALAQGLPPPAPPPPAPPPPAPTPAVVYRVHNEAAIHDYHTNPEVVRRMVNQLILAVTHQP